MRSATDIAHLLTTASTLRRLGPYEITDDPGRVSVDVVQELLTRHFPSRRGVDRDRVESSIRMSLPLSAHLATCTPSMVGFVRVVTDTVTRSWLEDLFVLREHRRRGIAGALVRAALAHPSVAGTTTVVESAPEVRALFAGLGFRAAAESRVLVVRQEVASPRDRPRQVCDSRRAEGVGELSPPPRRRAGPERAGQADHGGDSDERHHP